MGYQRGNDRFGGENRYGGNDQRWRERSERRERDYGRGDRPSGYRDDDRGFIDRAGDELRSWFGDDEAERRREQDRLRYEREQGYGARESAFGGGYYGDDFDRPGARYAAGDLGPGVPRATFGTPAGGTGTAPPGGYYGGGYDMTAGGGYGGTTARFSRAERGERSQSFGRDLHDPHYAQWRDRQIDSLDRDYDEYRREHQSKFEQEFGGWREKRQSQRSALGRVTEHMEVLGADGQPIGIVDKVRGDRIILTKSDDNAGGRHHSIPCAWIESVDERVTVNKSSDEALWAWRDEDNSRALFEREDQGSEGPHVLNRSFSGTY